MKYCQFNEEDMLLRHLPSKGFFVEIGCLPDFKFSNTKLLHDNGWSGVWIDKVESNGVIAETVTPDNINSLKDKYFCDNVDFLSLDIDGNDYHVFKAMSFYPKFIMIEYNNKKDTGYMDRDDNYEWKGQKDFGSSKSALIDLAISKGYSIVDFNDVNILFKYNE